MHVNNFLRQLYATYDANMFNNACTKYVYLIRENLLKPNTLIGDVTFGFGFFPERPDENHEINT